MTDFFAAAFAQPANAGWAAVSDHIIKGAYEADDGCRERGTLDLTREMRGTQDRFVDALTRFPLAFSHDVSGSFVVTCSEGAYRFFPDAGELARIGMAGWVDRI